MTLGERIKKVRKALDLTQREFGERIAMKQNSVAQIEMGRSTSDQTIFAICKTFNVDKHWLRTGEGGDAAMFVELPKNEALAAQIQNFLQGGTDSFRERLVSLLLRLSPEQWEALEGYLRELIAPSDPPSAPSTKLYVAARDGSRIETEVDDTTLPENDTELPE